MGSGVEAGLAQVAAGLAAALAQSERTTVLLETTAGQGTYLGACFEHLGRLLDLSPALLDARLGVCFDTCHAFVAGYDIGTAGGTRRPGTPSTARSASTASRSSTSTTPRSRSAATSTATSTSARARSGARASAC